jgi:hypothetical protein
MVWIVSNPLTARPNTLHIKVKAIRFIREMNERVLVVQPWRRYGRNEELIGFEASINAEGKAHLTAVCLRSCIGHAQRIRPVVLG